MPASFGPYTPIRQAGDLYFVSGQIGVDPSTKTAAPDVAAQTSAALLNLSAVLATHKLHLDDVVKTTVFITNMDHFAAMNETYQQFFQGPRPARSCVAVAELPRVANVPQLVEIEAVAMRDAK